MIIIRKVAIYDKDTEYALSLAEYISEYRTREYKVFAFSEEGKLEDFIKSEGTDVVLADEETIERLKAKVDAWSIKYPIVLTGEKEGECLGRKSIFKYQAVESIVAEIKSIFDSEVEEKEVAHKECREIRSDDFGIIMLVSPAFPIDVCNVALGINHYYDNQYLIADYSLLSVIFDGIEDKYMSQAIYLLESGLADISTMGECVSERNGSFYISGLNDCSDVWQLERNGLNRFWELLKEMGYKGIIMVCDNNSAITLSGLVNKENIVVLEGKGKKVRDYTYNLIKEMECIGDKRVRLINTDGIRDKYLNQVIDFKSEEYRKGGLYKLINEICK